MGWSGKDVPSGKPVCIHIEYYLKDMGFLREDPPV